LAPPEKRSLYALFLAIDANFRMKRKQVSSEEADPGLNNGAAFFSEVKAYMKHVSEHWEEEQEVRAVDFRQRCFSDTQQF
jgi:DNA polymerase I-like protein with 3'-5' exonuclease and polymerase domains